MENTCHGCGNKYDDCICEELESEMNEVKYPDDDPLDGQYDDDDDGYDERVQKN